VLSNFEVVKPKQATTRPTTLPAVERLAGRS
jgi:hypothetical protein